MKNRLPALALAVGALVALSWFLEEWNVSDEAVYQTEIPGGAFALTEGSRVYLTKRKFVVPPKVQVYFRSDGMLRLTNLPYCFASGGKRVFRSAEGKWQLVRGRTIILDFAAPNAFGMIGSGGGMCLVRRRTQLLLSVAIDGAKSGNYLYFEKPSR